MTTNFRIIGILSVVFCTSMWACKEKKPSMPAMFDVLEHTTTGLHFANQLTASPDFNMLKYMYFYNGAGLGAGDLNNDGKVDLFFASNQGQNTLYLNEGNLKFKDVTSAAKIPNDGGWSTGISIADVNDDGMLDIYVCRVGKYEHLKSKNQLLICKNISVDGVPLYEDQAAAYGVDFSGFSTQASFFDYDLDGDLDIFLLNHSLRYNSTFAPRSSYESTVDSLSRDILYRNDGGHYTDVSSAAGINQSIIGYGLGIVVSDINMDGWPDIYIGNDFHENDYLYINNQHGGFQDELTQQTMHTSQFSMGVDAGDINNDAYPDIIAADMLPSDPYILRRSLGEDEYNTFQIKIRNGYNHQYARNTLQLNRQNGSFSEIGLYAGVGATDWSWATLWLDFDNDGWKDLFISNGIPKRLNDIDYVNYVSNDEIQSKIRDGRMEDRDMTLIEKFPQIKLPNRFFRNKKNASFDDIGEAVTKNPETFSNGSIYADLDNDGDLDIVVNNIDAPALIYRNKTNDDAQHPSMQLQLQGPVGNRNAVGARLLLFDNGQVSNYEKIQARGFQSSMEIPLQISYNHNTIDSAWLIWPDRTCQSISLQHDSSLKKQITYQKGLPLFDFTKVHPKEAFKHTVFEDITRTSGLDFTHVENLFNEFDREPLMPFMASREGPALTLGDINGDGLQDVFVGSVKWEKSAVFIQSSAGKFSRTQQPDLENDSTFEDVDATWTDVNNDTYLDLVVASGGNEYYGESEFLLPRVYLNDGKGHLSRKKDAFDPIYMTASCVVAHDFNGDGKQDLFIGGRAVPFEYGAIPRSYLLQNDGTGKFKDVTSTLAPELVTPGLVKNASLVDIDKDGDGDLVLAMEWDGIAAYLNTKGKFAKKVITENKGWWNFVQPVDIDQDGDMDFVAGNQGLNSRLKATQQEPVKFYYYDFDGNQKKEQVITYFVQGEEIPFGNKGDLERQMPFLKKKFLYAEDFAKASLYNIFEKKQLSEAQLLTANYFSHAVFINDGKMNFTVKALPWQTQLSVCRDISVLDANGDKFPDLLLVGNFYPNNIQMGRNDADQGSVLINNGKGEFTYEPLGNLHLSGEVRHIRKLTLPDMREIFILAKNNEPVQLLQLKKKP